ncbi:MAG: SCP2 sterol-binding domain-containing protein [Pseudomonadales bacterium]|nr:SCP2 sterol-binding domain-containing protein [Pseudomonadales bacterium]
MIDPALNTAALAAVERVVNQALAHATNKKADLAALDDCVFALHCTAPPMDAYLQTGDGKIRLMGVYDGPVTTSVRGVASDFAELATAKDPAAALINGKIELKGDSAPLIELQKIITGLEIDWEAPLVEALGDVAGHQVARALRGAHSWGRQASSGLGRQLEEFIHEEARLSPPRLELEDFYRDIRQLGLRVDRLESRTQRLRKRLQKLRER